MLKKKTVFYEDEKFLYARGWKQFNTNVLAL